MSRTAEDHLREMIGELFMQMAVMRARLEALDQAPRDPPMKADDKAKADEKDHST